MEQGKATLKVLLLLLVINMKPMNKFAQLNIKMVICHVILQELDKKCEELINDEFGERCNFDVDDAVQKLEKLGIIAKVSLHLCFSLS